ncbi:hypothetical protein Taro_040942 [Colocasia esculenta]|uniref:Uncharacterized protein n=1 Tax=Colocasia esculenta TaxID=4460 RepID=A0A843WK63_COLES|nr:hypothetical protein [Colocasia esculenta]
MRKPEGDEKKGMKKRIYDICPEANRSEKRQDKYVSR